ncbi:hypothetical protein Hdeb2414_s0003g00083851 [Helianthus debilis subsp. tardiflorus]
MLILKISENFCCTKIMMVILKLGCKLYLCRYLVGSILGLT